MLFIFAIICKSFSSMWYFHYLKYFIFDSKYNKNLMLYILFRINYLILYIILYILYMFYYLFHILFYMKDLSCVYISQVFFVQIQEFYYSLL